MVCESCGEKPKNTAKDFTKAVIEIDNPETLVLFRKVVIPLSMGDETQVPAAVGKYYNVLLVYEANNHAYLYSSDGIPTLLTSEVAQDLEQKIDTVANDLDALETVVDGKQNKLTAGTNITITNDIISATNTDTTYTAGNAITIDATDNNRIDAAVYPADFFTATDSVRGEGKSITLEGVISAPMKSLELEGDTYQQTDPAPNPDYPQTVQTVTGEQTVTVGDGVNSESFTVDLGSIELCKIGDYQDYIYKNGDDWYVHKETNKVVLSGTESFGKSGSTEADIFSYNLQNGDTNGTTEVKSNYFQYANSNILPSIRKYNQYIYFVFSSYGTTDVTGFKSWLSTHNTEAYYILATPTDTRITDANLIAQLNTLQNNHLYDGTNIITVAADGANLPATLVVEGYKKSLSGVIEAVPDAQVQSNWAETDIADRSYIKNKPALSTVATTGSYNDLTNKPTIDSSLSTSSSNAVKNSVVSTTLNQSIMTDIGLNPNVSTTTVQIDGSKRNLYTNATSTKSVVMPVASSTQAGVMNSATYDAVTQNTSNLNAIMSGAVAITGLSASPSQSDLTTAWQTETGLTTLINRASIYDVDNDKVWTYYTNDTTWHAASNTSQVTINTFTNSSEGTIKGSTNTGQVFAESDGTGSVNGWDTLSGAVSTNTGNITSLQTAVAGKQDTLTAGTNISISSNTISATDTTYTAGSGLSLTGTTFSVDTSTIAQKSEIPTVNNATLTIQKNGTSVATFTANSSTNTTANITVPTITMQTTDPGEGAPLAANNFIAVYNA